MRDEIESEEDETHSSDNGAEDSDGGTLQESEEILAIGRRLTWLKIRSSFVSITEKYNIVWRNPLFEPPPSCNFNQEERTKEEIS
jgi:hypothetical protein